MVQNDGWYIVFLNRYSGVHELFDYPMYIFFIATKNIFIISDDILNTITAFYSKYMCVSNYERVLNIYSTPLILKYFKQTQTGAIEQKNLKNYPFYLI
jgi:hypothetical protein